MTATQDVIHVTGRRSKIRCAVERHDTPSPSVGVTAIALSIADVVNSVADILIVALQPIRKIDIESLQGSITPGLIVGQTGIAWIDHGPIACCGIGFAPA